MHGVLAFAFSLLGDTVASLLLALLRFKHVHRVLAVPFLAWVHRVFTLTIIRHGEAAISGSGIAADLAAQDLGGSNMYIVCLRFAWSLGETCVCWSPENELAFQAGWSPNTHTAMATVLSVGPVWHAVAILCSHADPQCGSSHCVRL